MDSATVPPHHRGLERHDTTIRAGFAWATEVAHTEHCTLKSSLVSYHKRKKKEVKEKMRLVLVWLLRPATYWLNDLRQFKAYYQSLGSLRVAILFFVSPQKNPSAAVSSNHRREVTTPRVGRRAAPHRHYCCASQSSEGADSCHERQVVETRRADSTRDLSIRHSIDWRADAEGMKRKDGAEAGGPPLSSARPTVRGACRLRRP